MPGPWDNDVLVYRVAPSGEVVRVATFERAGVPTVARMKDGRLIAAHQYFPENDDVNFDKVAVRFSSDEGRTWSGPQVIRLTGLPEGMRFPFDPTLVALPDGQVRLYFTSLHGRRFEEDVPAIYSAISTNGLDYTFEPGMRFGIEGQPVIDCAVVLHQSVFHLYSPDNGAQRKPGEPRGDEPPDARPRDGVGYHAASKDGLQFTRLEDVQLEGRRRWLGNAQSDGTAITFFGTGDAGSPGAPGLGQPRGGVWMAGSRDGQTWRLLESPAIPGADPGAVKTSDGGWIVVATGPPRPLHFPPQPQGPRRPPGQFEPEPGMPSPRPDSFGPRGGEPRQPGQIRVTTCDSQYAIAPPGKPGRFVTGQEADLMLGGIDFNNTGGPLLFNHPTGLASDGKRLLLTDRWNNRVLIWTKLPSANTPPDLVLGQPNFTANNPGTGRENLNWPGNVAIAPDDSKVAVTDTNNDRVLIWNSFPSRNAAPADVVLELSNLSDRGSPGPQQVPPRPRAEAGDRRDPNVRRPPGPGGPMQRLGWPWGVWTDGKKFAVVCTHGASVLIWNSIPTRDNQPPDLVLRPRDAGTPRNITSDGTFFALSDHNNGPESRPATMVWRTFPTSTSQPPDFSWREWMKGTFTPDHKLVLAGMSSLWIWNQTPQTAAARPDIELRPTSYRNGDGPDVVLAGGRLYVCNCNGNNVLAWNSLPTRNGQPPDFSLGSGTPDQDTLAEHFFITNPVVATDGQSLFVSSDFDRKLYVWRRLPDQSGAKPDVIYSLPDAPWDNALCGQTLVLAGKQTVYIWKRLPLHGEQPDVILTGRIGSVEFQEITGVALDEKHLCIADRQANRIYVWENIPQAGSAPKFTLAVENPGRLSSDGRYLAAAPFAGPAISVWRIAELSSSAQATRLGGPGRFNLPGKCVVAKGHLFVADTSFNRVQVWHQAEDALAGQPPDALLGAKDDQDRSPEIGRDKLFMPGTVAFDGSYLWVGEFKFSTRILRFSPKATEQSK
jgi:hypothetical protein